MVGGGGAAEFDADVFGGGGLEKDSDTNDVVDGLPEFEAKVGLRDTTTGGSSDGPHWYTAADISGHV